MTPKLRVFSFSLLLVVAGFTAAWLRADHHRTPNERKKAVNSQQFDFGEARGGTSVFHAFVVDNPGDSDIPIVGELQSCSCIVCGSVARVIAAHAAVQIPVEMRLSHESPRSEAHVVLVRGDGGASVELSLIGRVVESLPSMLDLGSFSRHSGVTREIILRPVGAVGRTVHAARFDNKLLSIRWSTSLENSANTVIIVTANPSIPYGNFSTDVLVETDDAEHPQQLLTVRGTVLQPVEIEPAAIAIDAIAGEAANASATFRIYSPDRVAFHLSKVESVPKGLLTFTVNKNSSGVGSLVSDAGIAITARPSAHFQSTWSTVPIVVAVESDDGSLLKEFSAFIHGGE